jgi:hypothetical protein
MLKFIAVFVVVALLAGCAGGPVGLGGTYKVLFKTDSAITIQYDSVTESQKDVVKVASEHCGQYDKSARISNMHADTFTFGLIKTISFSCDRA